LISWFPVFKTLTETLIGWSTHASMGSMNRLVTFNVAGAGEGAGEGVGWGEDDKEGEGVGVDCGGATPLSYK
jgi:hypothetical protein